MAELQRSVTSFRRQGSSGLVWDDKFIAAAGLGEQNQNQNQNQNQPENEKQNAGVGSTATLDRSRSAGARPYWTVNVAPSFKDPPSPKVATCGLCGFFGKPIAAKSKSRKRR